MGRKLETIADVEAKYKGLVNEIRIETDEPLTKRAQDNYGVKTETLDDSLIERLKKHGKRYESALNESILDPDQELSDKLSGFESIRYNLTKAFWNEDAAETYAHKTVQKKVGLELELRRDLLLTTKIEIDEDVKEYDAMIESLREQKTGIRRKQGTAARDLKEANTKHQELEQDIYDMIEDSYKIEDVNMPQKDQFLLRLDELIDTREKDLSVYHDIVIEAGNVLESATEEFGIVEADLDQQKACRNHLKEYSLAMDRVVKRYELLIESSRDAPYQRTLDHIQRAKGQLQESSRTLNKLRDSTNISQGIISELPEYQDLGMKEIGNSLHYDSKVRYDNAFKKGNKAAIDFREKRLTQFRSAYAVK